MRTLQVDKFVIRQILEGILGVDVRTCVIHLLGIYVTILYNWLIF